MKHWLNEFYPNHPGTRMEFRYILVPSFRKSFAIKTFLVLSVPF